MKPTPKGWPRLSAAIFYDDAPAAIDWLCRALGFEVRAKIKGKRGRIEHSELVYSDAVVMVATSGKRPRHPAFPPSASPHAIGGVYTQSLMLYVDGLTEHYERARAAGAKILEKPKIQGRGPEDGADHSYGALDPEGHMWWFIERVQSRKDA